MDPYRNELIPPLVNKPALVRMGGKRYLSELIVSRINQMKYTMYLEPFIGGGRIFLEKDPHFVELINDREERIANFHYCCKHFPEEMQQAQETIIKDENLFFRLYDKYHDSKRLQWIREEIKTAWERCENISQLINTPEFKEEAKKILIGHAIDFYFYSNMAFRGSLTARTMTYPENDPETESNRIRWRVYRPINWLAERMRRTTVLNKDFIDIIKLGLKYNHNRIWYFDPPYWGTESYEIEFPWDRYIEFRDILRTIPKSDYWMLSINNDEEIIELFSEFKIEEVETHYTTGGVGQRKDVTELLITPKWDPILKPKVNPFHSLEKYFKDPKEDWDE